MIVSEAVQKCSVSVQTIGTVETSKIASTQSSPNNSSANHSNHLSDQVHITNRNKSLGHDSLANLPLDEVDGGLTTDNRLDNGNSGTNTVDKAAAVDLLEANVVDSNPAQSESDSVKIVKNKTINTRHSLPIASDSFQRSPSSKLSQSFNAQSGKTPSKSAHADALAEFVARRRTMSPSASAPGDLPSLQSKSNTNKSNKLSGSTSRLASQENGRYVNQYLDSSIVSHQVQISQEGDDSGNSNNSNTNGDSSLATSPLASSTEASTTTSMDKCHKNSAEDLSKGLHGNKTFSKQPLSVGADLDFGLEEETHFQSSKTNKTVTLV